MSTLVLDRPSSVKRRRLMSRGLWSRRTPYFESSVPFSPGLEPVIAANDSVVFDPSIMETNKLYVVDLKGEVYAYRKVSDHEVEIYGLAEAA